MRKKLWIGLALLLVIPGLLLTVSCAKKTVQSEASMSEMPKTEAAVKSEAVREAATAKEDSEAAARAAELERQRKIEEERLKAQQLREAQLAEERRQAEMAMAKQAEETKKNAFLNDLVLYAFDSSVLSPAAQTVLTRKAYWLKENSRASVIIEGHCDERGTIEYNLALGWRRAEAAKAFLVDLGISASRMTTISYGKERPFVKGNSEDAWSKNRRAHFVLE